MSYSVINTRVLHEEYEAASPYIRAAVDKATEAVMDTMRLAGYATAGDDRCEELVAAIFYYLKRSEQLPDTPYPQS